METTKVIAWLLEAPSASGGKLYATLVMDGLVLFGWGRADKGVYGMQFKHQQFSTPDAAQQGALLKTEAKEKRGYTMIIPPKVRTFAPDSRNIPALIRQGSPMDLADLVQEVIQAGSPI